MNIKHSTILSGNLKMVPERHCKYQIKNSRTVSRFYL